MYKLSTTEAGILASVAAEVGTTPASLYRLIAYESAWNPLAENPRSSAKGLIQFIDSTAEWIGFPNGSGQLVQEFPTIAGQLDGPVREYLKRYGPYSDEYQLFMAVFYPAARTWPADQEFPANVQAVNPGIRTPADYVAAVYKSGDYTDQTVASAIGKAALSAGVILALVAGGFLLYYYNS